MADFVLAIDGYTPALANYLNVDKGPSGLDGIGINLWSVGTAGAPSVPIYKMRGMDAAISGLYDTWVVTGVKDPTGINYHGSLATPLRDIIVIDTWNTT